MFNGPQHRMFGPAGRWDMLSLVVPTSVGIVAQIHHGLRAEARTTILTVITSTPRQAMNRPPYQASGNRNLLRTHQVREKIADFIVSHLLQDPFRHHRYVGDLLFFDFISRNDHLFRCSLDGDGVV